MKMQVFVEYLTFLMAKQVKNVPKLPRTKKETMKSIIFSEIELID
jgi:hypothetical protein